MQKVCNSEDGGLNDALKLARRVENDGVVASAALELSGSWATPGTATTVSTINGSWATHHGDDGERVSVQFPYRWWSMRSRIAQSTDPHPRLARS